MSAHHDERRVILGKEYEERADAACVRKQHEQHTETRLAWVGERYGSHVRSSHTGVVYAPTDIMNTALMTPIDFMTAVDTAACQTSGESDDIGSGSLADSMDSEWEPH